MLNNNDILNVIAEEDATDEELLEDTMEPTLEQKLDNMAVAAVITNEQVNQIISLHAMADKRLERAIERGSESAEIYRAEVCAIENVLDIIGIEY